VKGQAAIMEKIFTVFFMVIVLIALIIFLGVWNVLQINVEGQEVVNERAMSLMKLISTHPLLVKEASMFDDSKLEVAEGMPCEGFEKLFGKRWYAEISDIDGTKWSMCILNEKNASYDIPVNIYHKDTEKVTIGKLKVGIYL